MTPTRAARGAPSQPARPWSSYPTVPTETGSAYPTPPTRLGPSHPARPATARPTYPAPEVAERPREGRLLPYWCLAVIALAAVCVSIIVYSDAAIRWTGDANSLLNYGDYQSAVAGAAATRDARAALRIFDIAEIVCAICFILWFRVAYGKLQRAGGQLRFSKGWAIGAWFVPFMSLVRPKKIANDLWLAGDSLASRPLGRSQPNRSPRPVSPAVHWWWALYLAGGAIWALGVTLARSTGSPGQTLIQVIKLERTGFYVSLAGAAALIVAATLAATFMWQVTRGYDSATGRGMR